MTLYSAFRNYFNFQVNDLCLDLVFRETCTFSLDFFTGPNNVESSGKLLKPSQVKICCEPAAFWKKKTPAQFFPVIFGTFFRTPALNNTLGHHISYFTVALFLLDSFNPATIYLFKVNNRNTRKKCEIC